MPKCPIPECRNERTTNLVCDDHAAEIATQARADKRREKALLAEGTIYYLRLDEKIKIGWTSDLWQRLKAYPPHAILLADHPGTQADERDLHRTFTPFRIAGREWYREGEELKSHIKRYAQTDDEVFEKIRTEARADFFAWVEKRPAKPVKPRPLTGRALARAIINGEVDE